VTKPGQQDAVTRHRVWATILERLGGRAGVLVAFAVAYALLVWLGYLFREPEQQLTIMWPAAGLLFTALWVSDRQWWPAFIGIQIAIELLLGVVLEETFHLRLTLLYAIADSIDAIVGALLARLLIRDMASVKVWHTLKLALAVAIGAAASAFLGAYVATQSPSVLSYEHQLQIWWAGNWLGSLVVLPVVFGWVVPNLRNLHPELRLRSRIDLVLLLIAVAACTYYVFSAGPGGAISLLQLPMILAALLVFSAFRLPPRWSATLAMIATFIAAEMASQRSGPFVVNDTFVRLIQVQMFLASLVLIPFLFTMFIAEMRIAMNRLVESESRYRSFVEHSNEAVWRVELSRPMLVSMSVVEQRKWLEQYAHVAECSLSYGKLNPPEAPSALRPWRREIPWNAIYDQHLEQAALQNYSMDGLRFDVTLNGKRHTFITSFTGVVRDGLLLRIWGVARDVTDLVELNTRLAREQDRLRGYARQIVTAEERARRATAVDLHDGIGQELIGMGMTLEVLRAQAPVQSQALLDELRTRLREVQERTRHMISDLSPPGLYDLGLCPALQWLAIYLRTHEKLQVVLDCRVREELVDVEMRVLIFKLVRELLRNVVKHADINVANVTVLGDGERVKVEVRDTGRGFVWEVDLFGGRSNGFGLWSIEERVREVGGEFKVDTAPGRGARFEMILPLRRSDRRRGAEFHDVHRAGTED
jgi:signal transduction histidine kinase